MNIKEFKALQARRLKAASPKKNKYGAKQVVVDGIKFPSTKEGNRYSQLKLMEKAGAISQLRRQVNYKLSVCTYRADFVYMRNGEQVVEDAKGFKTEVYKLKKKMMQHELGIIIFES